MALKRKITADEFAGLTEVQQSNYKLDGDVYVVDLEGDDPDRPDDAALKRALDRVREEHARTREELKNAKAQADAVKDIDPVKYNEAIKKVQDIERRELEEQRRYSEIIANKDKEHDKIVLELSTRAKNRENQLLTQLDNEIIEHAATAALAKHKGAVGLLLPHARRFIKVNHDDAAGTTSLKVIDPATGEVMLSKKTGNPHTVDTFVGEVMREDDQFTRAFEGTSASGSGARGNGAGSGGANGAFIKISREDALDRDKYLAAKALADERKVPLKIDPLPGGEEPKG